MRKGESGYNHCPIAFTPTQEVCINVPEVFVDITDLAVPNIKPYYMISNYGRIWHKYKAEILSITFDSKGYLYKPLSTDNGNANCRVHRLVMMCFCYYPGCESLFVNHKDGNKTNNCLWNLEWVTAKENVDHAYKTGLNQALYLEPAKVHEVCKLLEDATIPLTRVAELTGVQYTTIQAIQNKRAHIDISDQYDIKPRKIGSNFTLEQVHSLCQYYQDHPFDYNLTLDEYCAKALRAVDIDNPGFRYNRTAKRIFKKETYYYVSKDYRF